jgi:hypothetical protein
MGSEPPASGPDGLHELPGLAGRVMAEAGEEKGIESGVVVKSRARSDTGVVLARS